MSFLSELRYEDLRRLRSLVKQVHMRHHPIQFMTDAEADKVIEALGPEVMMEQLAQAVDSKAISVD